MDSKLKNSCSNTNRTDNNDARSRYLLSALVHEIRNPLTLISSSLQLIEKSCPAVTENLLWSQLREDMQDTIFMLRDLSNPELEDQRPHRPVRIAPLLDKLARSFGAFAGEQGISFSAEIAENLPTISGNETKLKEAVLNLLLNAGDAAASRSDGAVSLSATQNETEILIHVRDNGAGIPEADRQEILKPYVTHKAAGTGIGLSVVRAVALQHGGRLTLETSTEAPDSYTDFCLHLPINHHLL